MEGQKLQNYIISKRIADKARAPLLTPARNALKKALTKLAKSAPDAELHQINPEQANGSRLTSLETLMRGQGVILQAWRCTRQPIDVFDCGEFEMVAQVIVKL